MFNFSLLQLLCVSASAPNDVSLALCSVYLAGQAFCKKCQQYHKFSAVSQAKNRPEDAASCLVSGVFRSPVLRLCSQLMTAAANQWLQWSRAVQMTSPIPLLFFFVFLL